MFDSLISLPPRLFPLFPLFPPNSHTVFFKVLATYYNRINLVSQSESRIKILWLFDWMAQFSLLLQELVL